jgi:hypothetical protein
MGINLEDLGAEEMSIFLWLAIHNQCWTADRLAQRGLPNPSCCVLCDQVGEDIQHILVGCVFSR